MLTKLGGPLTEGPHAAARPAAAPGPWTGLRPTWSPPSPEVGAPGSPDSSGPGPRAQAAGSRC